jgi:glycosyltransferase involved in cell wall biosynthesis
VTVICPELRSSVLERFYVGSHRVLYWRQKADLDATLASGEKIEKSTWLSTVRKCADSETEILEVPEPLWIRYWPRVVAMVMLARLLRAIMRRGAVTVCTYAIDNLDPAERLTVRHLDPAPRLNALFARAVTWAVAQSLGVLDAIAFGTEGAKVNYEKLVMLARPRPKTRVIEESLVECPMCYSEAETRARTLAARPKLVTFVGELCRRKGVHILLAAWRQSSLRHNGWRLIFCGSGDLDGDVRIAAATDPSISLMAMNRAGVHRLLAQSRAVVLPSVRVPRWREQVGLGTLEGEAHGCCLVVTRESGLADALARRSNARLVDPGSVADLREALDAIPEMAPARSQGYDSHVAASEWFRSLAWRR